jgi:hypothetical protein
MAIEFNLLYRWHATVSEEDVRWTEKHFKEKMAGIDPRTVRYIPICYTLERINSSKQASVASVKDFMTKAAHVLDTGEDVKQRTFGGSVVSGFTSRATLTLGITAFSETTAAVSEMRT